MLQITELLMFSILFLLMVHFLKQQWARNKFPPGPTPLPIIGNLWQLDFSLKRESLAQLTKSYGNIYTLWLGTSPLVVLNGYKAVREGLVTCSEELSARALTPLFLNLMGEKGVFLTSGHTWKQQKRFVMMVLRHLGMGTKELEDQIQEEVQHLLRVFASKQGRAFEPRIHIVRAVDNVICSFLFGHRFPYEDESFNKLIKAGSLIVYTPFTFWGRMYDALPGIMNHLKGLYQEVLGCNDFIHNLVKEEIQTHQERRKEGDEPHDFIDFYLVQMAKTKHDPTSTFNEDNLVQTSVDLLLGGMDTMATTLCWGFCYLLNCPDVQEKSYKEINALLGPSHTITYEDRIKLPYTNAVLHEILRFSNTTGVGPLRACSKDITVLGFSIPKGTLVLPNNHSVLYDPNFWETPWKFNPRHFLDSEDNFVSNKAFLSFSTGRRTCVGEPLAQIELFLFFTNLIRTFKFQLPEGTKQVSFEYILGGTRHPLPFEFHAIPH
nr:cytochrome P450 2J5-like [Anolis sagrei ordinatus]